MKSLKLKNYIKDLYYKVYNKIRFTFVDKEATKPAHITFENITHYLEGKYNKFVYDNGLDLPKHVQEQVKERYLNINQECLNKGTCISCGCNTEEKIFSSAKCDEGCFDEMLDRKTWNNLKKERQSKTIKNESGNN